MTDPGKDTLEVLERLSTAPGLSGYEHPVRDLVCGVVEPLCDEIHTDALGNLVGDQAGGRQRPPAENHVGRPHGRNRLHGGQNRRGRLPAGHNVGGIDVRNVLGEEVIVHGREDLIGVIGAKPPHLTTEEERNRPVPLMSCSWTWASPRSGPGNGCGRRPGHHPPAFPHPGRPPGDGQSLGQPGQRRLPCTTGWRCCRGCATGPTCTRWPPSRKKWACGGARGQRVRHHARRGHRHRRRVRQHARPEDEGHHRSGQRPRHLFGANVHPRLHDHLVASARRFNIPFQLEVAPGRTGTDAWAIQVIAMGFLRGFCRYPCAYAQPGGSPRRGRHGSTGRLLGVPAASLTADDVVAGWAPPLQGRRRGGGLRSDRTELIIQLSEAVGVSGEEGPVRDIIWSHLRGKVDEAFTDTMGNLLVAAPHWPSRPPDDGVGPHGRSGPHDHHIEKDGAAAVHSPWAGSIARILPGRAVRGRPEGHPRRHRRHAHPLVLSRPTASRALPHGRTVHRHRCRRTRQQRRSW